MRIAVIDCETNGTEPWRHSLWEFGAVLVSPPDPVEGGAPEPEPIQFWVPADVEQASPDALRVNRYFDRAQKPGARGSADGRSAALDLAVRLSGLLFASCNVSFDVQFVTGFLRANGAIPTWHYSPIDVKSLCYGQRPLTLGMSTGELFDEFEIAVEQCLAYFDVRSDGRHSALADAYLAAALLSEVMGWGTLYGSRCDAHWGSYRCVRSFGHQDSILADGRHTDSRMDHAGATTWETDGDGFVRSGSLRGTGSPSYPLTRGV